MLWRARRSEDRLDRAHGLDEAAPRGRGERPQDPLDLVPGPGVERREGRRGPAAVSDRRLRRPSSADGFLSISPRRSKPESIRLR